MRRALVYGFLVLIFGGSPAWAVVESAKVGADAHAAEEAFRTPLSRMLGMEVRTATGERLGHVVDLMVDTANNRLAYAVVYPGDYLGIGKRLAVMPFGRAGVRAQEDHLTIDDGRAMRQAPRFEAHAWPDWDDFQSRFGDLQGSAAPTTANLPPKLHRATELLEARLEGWGAVGSRDIGDMRDVVVDRRDGRIAYALVDYDKGPLHLGKRVAVPMPAVRRERIGSNDLVATIDSRDLALAPAFERPEPSAPASDR